MNTKITIISDLHSPFEDQKALEATLKHIRKTRPALLILNGDILDCYKISRFVKDPESRNLTYEIKYGRNLLNQIQKSIDNETSIVWMDGNHEMRLQKYVWSKAPEISGLISISQLMGFAERGIEYHQYGYALNIDNIVIKHGNRVSSVSGGYTVKKELDKEDGSVSESGDLD